MESVARDIEEMYPKFAQCVKTVVVYDSKIERYLNRKYGVDTFENILAMQ
jgi:hypothetical protein